MRCAAELEPGDTVAGRYVVEAALGSGAFAAVFRARDGARDARVALKVLTRARNHAPAELVREEVRRAGAVRHPNVVRVLDHGETFLVMELLEGRTLEAELKEAGRLPARAALGWMRAVLRALAAVHREGLVHGDVKPANVMLHRGSVPKLIDFGAQETTGSPAYASPEKVRGLPRDGKADVYACGVMLYKMLTGALPIDGDTCDLENVAHWHLRRVAKRPGVSPVVDAFVLMLLEKKRSRRPDADSAAQLAEAVESYAP